MGDWTGVCQHCSTTIGRSASLQDRRGVYLWSYFKLSSGSTTCTAPETRGAVRMVDEKGNLLHHAPWTPDLTKPEEVEEWLTTG